VRARYSAQAFLGEIDLKPVRDLKEWKDSEEPAYIVLMLAHHHLLPLPQTEKEVQSVCDLFKPTSAVNPGKILESLAASCVDIVLHGHEHRRNLARYDSYTVDSNQIVVAAAASATGMETIRGCDSARASFNVLELRPDRSVWIQEIRGPSGDHSDWHPALPIQMLDSTTLRHNRFLRSLHLWRRDRGDYLVGTIAESHQSEWRKHITITAGRDAIVREYRSDWLTTDNEFSFRIQNDTGQPAQPLASLNLLNPSSTPKLLGFSPVKGERGAYMFRVDIGTSSPVAAASIETSYQWLDGIVLTADDLDLISRLNREGACNSCTERGAREVDSVHVAWTIGFGFPRCG
jgi:hypothetical protein